MTNHTSPSHDQIRRDARDSERAHLDSMPAFGDALARFLDRSDRSEDDTASVLLGGLSRRSLFRVGGITVAGAALLAACGSDKAASTTTTPATMSPTTMSPTTMVPGTTGNTMVPGSTVATAAGDIVLLRTASSIENLAVAAYQLAIDSGLVKTAAVADAAKLFQGHHRQHAELFQSTTKNMGGSPFTDPNPAVMAQLKPTIDALKDEQGVLMLALTLERAAAATYQAGVGTVLDATLNTALMSVGGVEARHAAVLASVLAQTAVPRAFGTTEGAVPPGTGV